jgi:hypothetical protein
MKKRSFLDYCLSAVCLFFLLPGSVMAVGNDTCLECHGDDGLERDVSTGYSASLFVDIEKLKGSPHDFTHAWCKDCHDGLKSLRNFPEYRHNFAEAGCISCHADIKELNWDNDVPHSTDLANPDCSNCHHNVTAGFNASVHAQADITCYDCHSYHAPVAIMEKLDVVQMQAEFCGKCHTATDSHDWLPQKTIHFASIQCTVCHAPEDTTHVRLRVINSKTRSYLTREEIFTALNSGEACNILSKFDVDHNGVISAGDGVLDGGEFRALAQAINSGKHLFPEITAELTSDGGSMGHKITSNPINDCEVCHIGGSAKLEKVQFEFPGPNGSATLVPVETRASSSFYVRNFYVLGGTKITLLDLIGALLFAGGVSVVILHSGAKYMTRSIRAKRAAEKSHK